MKQKSLNYSLLIATLLFSLASLLFWGFFYEQHLLQREQMQLFLLSTDFLTQHLTIQGGVAQYIGGFLVQFFAIPFAGTLVVTALLTWLQWRTKKLLAFTTKAKSILFLSFIPALVYWGLLCNNYYYLSGLIGYIISLEAILFYLTRKTDATRHIWGLFMVPLVYWLAGGVYFMLVFVMIIDQIISFIDDRRKYTPIYLLGTIFVAVIFPLIARHYFFIDTLLQSYLSHAYYKISVFFPLPLMIAFALLPVLYLLSRLIRFSNLQGGNLISGTIAALILSGAIIFLFKNINRTEEVKMTYDNLASAERWDDIIQLTQSNPPVSKESIVATDMALAKKGQLSSHLLPYNAAGIKSLIFPFVLKGTNPMIRTELYYQLGLYNFARMYAMETIESTPDARYPIHALKRVAETCLISGEFNVARKYLRVLRHTFRYHRWANEELRNLTEKTTSNSEWDNRRKREPDTNFFFNEAQFDIAMLFLLRRDPHNQMAFEYLMADYLLQKNFDGFLRNLYVMKEFNYPKVPILFQQALAYLTTRHIDMKPVLEEFPVSQAVFNEIKQYAQAYINGGRKNPAQMKARFGNTYWYYLHFE